MSPNDADHIPLIDLERNLFERPEVLNRGDSRRSGGNVGSRTVGTAPHSHFFSNCSERRYRFSSNYIAESRIALAIAFVAYGVAFAKVFDFDDPVRHDNLLIGTPEESLKNPRFKNPSL